VIKIFIGCLLLALFVDESKRWRRRFVKSGNGWSALAEVSIAVCGVGHGIERALDNGVDTPVTCSISLGSNSLGPGD
jgi:hypothetical protein